MTLALVVVAFAWGAFLGYYCGFERGRAHECEEILDNLDAEREKRRHARRDP